MVVRRLAGLIAMSAALTVAIEPGVARDVRDVRDAAASVSENDTQYETTAAAGQIVTLVMPIDAKSGRSWTFSKPGNVVPVGLPEIKNGAAIYRVMMAAPGYGSLRAIYRKAGDEDVPFTPHIYGGSGPRTRYITFHIVKK